jgi:MoaA/NifB/PqqE/SkfB family radical SAM enzyme
MSFSFMSVEEDIKFDIKIDYQCNNHCLFCVQGRKREVLPFKDYSEIRQAIKKASQEGIRKIVLTGGEPALHPDIIKIIKLAKESSFQNIQIQSNGRMFSYLDFCKKAIEAGANEFALSLHGHTSKLHDFLTDAPGSFSQTVLGIRNLKKLGKEVITNTVITKYNYRFLPDIARLLVSLNVSQYQFAFIHITGQAEENKEQIVPRKKTIMPYIKKGLDIGIKAGKSVMTEAIPYCLMNGYEDYIAENKIPESKVHDIDFVVESFSEYRKNIGKVKGPQCSKCKYFSICEGPWKEYPELYGWSEFKPISKGK